MSHIKVFLVLLLFTSSAFGQAFVGGGASRVTTDALDLREGANTLNTNLWVFSTNAVDLISNYGNTGGSQYLQISKSPYSENSETVLSSKFTVRYPCKFVAGLSMSQRVGHEVVSIGMAKVDANGNYVTNAAPTSVQIATNGFNQATTTATVDCLTPHGLAVGDRVDFYNMSDSRANYCQAIVATTPTIYQFTFTATALGTITSLTLSNVNGLFVKSDPLCGMQDAFGLFFDSTTAANAMTYSRANNGSMKVTASAAIGTTAATAASAANFTDSFIQAHNYDFRFRPDDLLVRGFPVNNVTVYAGYVKSTDIIPDPSANYKLCVRFKRQLSASHIAGDIVSIAKTGSTTWTVTTRAAHSLTNGYYVTIYGNRGTTDFPNCVTPLVATVTGANAFTVTNLTGTATNYGGVCIQVNGSSFANVTPATMCIQSMSRTNNVLTLVGSATWSGVTTPGETVYVAGLTGTAGEDYSAYQGYYKIGGFSTSSLYLVSPGTNFAAVNCGGCVLKTTDLRLHSLRLYNYTRMLTDVEGGAGNIADIPQSIPVAVTTGTLALSASVVTNHVDGAVAHDGAIGGNPVRTGGRAITANYTAVATGDTADYITTLVGAQVVKPFSIPELDWSYPPAPGGLNNSATPVIIRAAPGAALRSYITALNLSYASLSAPTELVIRDGTFVSPSQTIAGNILYTSAAHGLTVGDWVMVSTSTVTGLSAGTQYYVVNVSGTTGVVFGTSPGTTTNAISGSSVAATINHVLWRGYLNTNVASPVDIRFPSPLKGGVNQQIEFVTTNNVTGSILLNASGYVAP